MKWTRSSCCIIWPLACRVVDARPCCLFCGPVSTSFVLALLSYFFLLLNLFFALRSYVRLCEQTTRFHTSHQLHHLLDTPLHMHNPPHNLITIPNIDHTAYSIRLRPPTTLHSRRTRPSLWLYFTMTMPFVHITSKMMFIVLARTS